MDTTAAVTRKDIEDVLNVLGAMMNRIDERFTILEDTKADKTDTDRIIGLLDSHEKRIEHWKMKSKPAISS